MKKVHLYCNFEKKYITQMKNFNKIEWIGFMTVMMGSLGILSTFFIESELKLGNIGVGINSVGLLLFLYGNHTRTKEQKNK